MKSNDVTTQRDDILSAQPEEESAFSIQNIMAIFMIRWKWFVVSVFICCCFAMVYLRYKSPVYQVAAKILIKEDQRNNRSTGLLSSMQDLGFMYNSAGIENEIEVIHSQYLTKEVVEDLKLYVKYQLKGRIKNQLLYKNQALNVDIDPTSLQKIEQNVKIYGTPQSVIPITLEITQDSLGYHVLGESYSPNITSENPEEDVTTFEARIHSLPATITTSAGTLTFTKNTNPTCTPLEGKTMIVSIIAPSLLGAAYMDAMSVEPTSKETTIALVTLNDQNVDRGLDFLEQLCICYNRQANADKNETALKTEEFINGRLEKIDSELGTTEDALETYKKRNKVTELKLDATQTLAQTSQYSTKLQEAETQIQLLDYLREYVDNPSNKYQIIPSNVGLADEASKHLINQFNQNVLDRNRMLRTASEIAPQVMTLTSTLDDLQRSIQTALLQARKSADIQMQGIKSQYAKYQSRVSSTPEQERILTQIGRQQEVKSGLYLMLLEKREENSISLAATADKGKLIDEPAYVGKVSPKKMLILLLALIFGFGIPLIVFILIQMTRYKIEGHDDVAKLSNLPIVADVAVASDAVKDSAGIVVKENKNYIIDEIFRSMRTNIQFMMKENEKVILFTSSTSGEGKTFNAANLAVSFSLLNKKVILVGLDIRKPALGRLFGISDRTLGVTPLLVKQKVTEQDVAQQIVPSGINANLDIMMAGTTPPNPTELLAKDNLKDIMDILRGMYDYIILDTAPVGLVSDTLQIAKMADLSVYVCRADFTPKACMEIANRLSDDDKLPNLCIVINGVDMSKKKNKYYYSYNHYYGRYGKYRGYGHSAYGTYGAASYGTYTKSHYGVENDNSVKK